MTDEKIKVVQIEPCSFGPWDFHIAVVKSETWKEVLEEVERELDSQWTNREDENGDGWGGLEIKVKCKYMTQEQLDEITEE